MPFICTKLLCVLGTGIGTLAARTAVTAEAGVGSGAAGAKDTAASTGSSNRGKGVEGALMGRGSGRGEVG